MINTNVSVFMLTEEHRRKMSEAAKGEREHHFQKNVGER